MKKTTRATFSFKRTYFVYFILILSVIIVFAFYYRDYSQRKSILFKNKDQTGSSSVPSKVLRIAPPFVLENSKGEKISLSDIQKKYIILHFWASWCPPCLNEIVEWAERAQKSKDLPIQWIAVSLDQNWQDIEKVLSSSKPFSNLLSLRDPQESSNQNLASRYGSFQFPETYLLSPLDQKKEKRSILQKWIGPQDWNGTEMIQYLKTLSLSESKD